MGGVGRFLKWFLPPTHPDADELDRMKLAVLTAWVMVVVFVILSTIHLAARNLLEALINLGLATAAAAGPLALRLGISYRVVLNAVMAVCFAGTISLVLVHGAGVNTATVAIAEVPIFATLLGGIRIGALWVVLSGTAGVVIGFLGRLGRLAPTSTYETRLFNDHAALLVITGTLFLVAALYEHGRRNSLARIAALNASRQVIEREKMEVEIAARIAHTERLASLGRIAAAAAHEINNPLSYVANNLEFAQWAASELEGQDEMRNALVDAQEGVERIERIVRDLRGVTSHDADTIGSVDLSRVMMTATKMAAAHTRPRARVTTTFADTRRVVGNEGRLVQVFLNLLVNAAQALPEGNALHHEIKIRTRAAGDRVEITVEDTGSRVRNAVILGAKELEFSKHGDGAALGLALSQGILDSIGGTLHFDSRPGSTIATVTLIAGTETTVAPPAEAPSARVLDVLIIDDEIGVARAIARGLRPHNVTIVERGREGLSLLAEGRHFDLILCDLMMPELSGMDVHDEITRAYPHVLPHLAFMSGGAFTERAKEFCARITLPFLDKPIDLKRIRALLQEVRYSDTSIEASARHAN
ncbi:MAG TPA: ATP-binding protein [Kofleriaceae bacterium]